MLIFVICGMVKQGTIFTLHTSILKDRHNYIVYRCVPGVFYRVHTLEGVRGSPPLYGVRGEALCF